MAPRTVSKKQKMEAAVDDKVNMPVTEDPVLQMTDSDTETSKPMGPRRSTMVDPLEIKALLMQDSKGARTKAIKLLERLSKQMEKIQSKMSKKKATGPRKLSAYNVYTKKHMVDVQDIESKLRMKELGQRWKKLSEKDKAKYKKMAEEANAALQAEA